jgi:hypothetical protein
MNKRIVFFSIIAFAMAIFGFNFKELAPKKKPNILFILVDDWGHFDLHLQAQPSTKHPTSTNFIRKGCGLTKPMRPTRVAYRRAIQS